jgi:hypothetical protein
MDHTSEDLKRLWHVSRRVATGLVLAVAALLYVAAEDGVALALGLILGALASMLRYRLKYSALVQMPRAGAGKLVRSRFFGYLITAAALAVAFLARPLISPWTTIPGLFVMNVCLLAVEVLVIQRRDAQAEGGSTS